MEVFTILGNPAFWYGVLRSTTPILLAGMAALIAGRCGIVNMAIEGILLMSALGGVLGSAAANSVIVGVLVALLIGILMTLFLAFFSMKMRADEIMVAIALNLLSTGLSIFILYIVSGNKASSSSIQSLTMPTIDIPLIKDIPFLGKIISGQNIMVYVALVLVFVMNYLLFKTPLGLRIRSVGGNPHAAQSVGVSVEKTRYIAMAISGALAGLAGAYLSMGYLTMFTKGMSAGRGYIALAAANIGGGAPIGTMFASVLFGFFESLANNLQGFGIPVEFVYMIPYVATIIMFTYACYRRATRKKKMVKAQQA